MESRVSIIVLCLLLLPGVAGAQIVPPMKGYGVEVTFSNGLERRMDSINNMEQRLEERFRENRHYAEGSREAGTQRFAESRTAGTDWAGERLIGEPSGFTLENLVKAMVAYNLNRAVPDFEGQVEIDIARLQLRNPSVAFLESSRSYAIGRITVTNADGSVRFDDEVQANLVIDSTVDTSYDGPELAFSEIDPSSRVGPTLAYFVKRVLQRAWPEQADEIVGPIIVRISGPNDRLMFNN